MSAEDDLHSDSAEVSAQLSEGLKTCRTVVDNYRSMLASAVRDGPPANDDDEQTVPPKIPNV